MNRAPPSDTAASFRFHLLTVLLVVLCLTPHPAAAQTLGGSCTAAIYSSDEISVVQNNIVVCNGSIWQSLLGAPAADPNYSIAIGSGVLVNDSHTAGTNGENNTGVGYQALDGNTTGYLNTAVGSVALEYGTTNNSNTAIGAQAMTGVSATPLTGGDDTAVGQGALYQIQGGAGQDTAIGQGTLANTTTGTGNTALGYAALRNNITGSSNTALGYASLLNTTASPSTAVGANALIYATTGTHNTAIGTNSMQGVAATPLTGSYNTAIGDSALLAIQGTAAFNTAVGSQALDTNTTGSDNTALGQNTLSSNTTGVGNVALGYDALPANTTASYNIAVGIGALGGNVTGADNTAIGATALTQNTASNNTAIGFNSLWSATTGTNSALGYRSGFYITTGSSNTLIGTNAMVGVAATPLTGNYNTAVGDTALTAIQGAAADNTVLGYKAGTAVTTGTDNTLVGYESGYGVTGTYNIILGEDPSSAITSGSSNILIGNSLTGLTATSSNQLNIGNVITGTGLGTPSSSTVTIAGSLQIRGAASGPAFMTTSDARIKTNITPLENGLAGIAALEGVTYTYRPPAEREVGKELNLPVDKPQMGVIAQNVEQVYPEAVETMGTTGVKSVNYNMLMAPMIEAVKTLKRQNEAIMAAVALLYVGLAVLFVLHMRPAGLRERSRPFD
jgi:hypothetical protein